MAEAAATSLSFLEGAVVWLVPPPSDLRRVTVNRVRQGPRGTLVRFDEVRSIDAASRLIGCDVLAPASLVPPAPDEEEAEDLTGFAVVDGERGDLGAIVETIITGANDVWIVHGSFGEVLIPVIDDVVDSIDLLSRRVDVRLLPGLLPEDGDE